MARPISDSKLDLSAAPPLLCFLMASGRSFLMHFLAALVVALLGVLPASAQIAPTEAELRGYGGLHAAAARGDVADIEARIAAAENKEALDARRRSPLHVAVYLKQHDAARALIRLGADPNKLDIDRYDIITIAAVANDVPMLKVALEGGGNRWRQEPHRDLARFGRGRRQRQHSRRQRGDAAQARAKPRLSRHGCDPGKIRREVTRGRESSAASIRS
jgi:ankyrin repeat protein